MEAGLRGGDDVELLQPSSRGSAVKTLKGEHISSWNMPPESPTLAAMTDALKKLLEAAKTAKPSPEQREQQRRSFVYGNTHFENELITREMVDREAENLAKDKK
jgi:hypothetical protein